MKTLKVTFAILLALHPLAQAAKIKNRTTLLTHGPGVASGAMGDTGTASVSDVSAMHYNSSLLMVLDRSQLYGMHWALFDGARYNFIGWAQLFDHSAFAVSATQFYSDNIEVRQKITDAPGQASSSQIFLQASWASRIEKIKLNYGSTFRYLTYKLYDKSATAMAADLGLSRQIWRAGSITKNQITVNGGLNAQNIVASAIKLTEEEKQPLVLRGGLSANITVFPRYSKEREELSFDLLTFALDVNNTDNQSLYGAGAQYFFNDKFYVRAGWNENLTAGIGIVWNSLQFDYAYLPSDFATLHQVGVSYKFGKEVIRQAQAFSEEYQSVYKKSKRIYERYLRDAETLIEQRKYILAEELLSRTVVLLPKENAQALELLKTCQDAIKAENLAVQLDMAKRYETQDNLESAYAYYLKALDVTPEDRNIQIYLTAFEKLSPSSREKINVLQDQYQQKVSLQIEESLRKDKFDDAEFELKKLLTIAPSGRVAQNFQQRISELKQLYTTRLLNQAIRNLQDDRPDLAFGICSLALRVNPGESSIADQRYLAQNMYLKNRKFTVKDKLYADKLYYSAALEFATGEQQKSAQTLDRLRTFNPVYDYLDYLEVPLTKNGIIK